MELNTLDLRNNGILSNEDSLLIDQLETVIIDSFNSYIMELVEINDTKGFELFLSVVNRNSAASQLMDYFSKIILLEERIKRHNPPDKILISDKYLA